MQQFAEVLRGLPAGTPQEKINAAAAAAEEGTPLTHIWDAVKSGYEWANRPLVGSEDAIIPFARHEHGEGEGPIQRSSEEFLSAMTSPLNLATAASSVGASRLAHAGFLGTGKVAKIAETAMQAPVALEGLHNGIEGYETGHIGQAALGIAQGLLAAKGTYDSLGDAQEDFVPARYTKDTQFRKAVLESKAGASLTDTPPQKFYRALNGDKMFYGINPGEHAGDRDLVAVMNNSEQGGALKRIMPDAIDKGANTLDAWRVRSERFPEGKLPTLYARHGFQVDRAVPYDVASYGEPPESLKAAWRVDGWHDGQPIPDVVYMRRPSAGPHTPGAATGGTPPASVAGQTTTPTPLIPPPTLHSTPAPRIARGNPTKFAPADDVEAERFLPMAARVSSPADTAQAFAEYGSAQAQAPDAHIVSLLAPYGIPAKEPAEIITQMTEKRVPQVIRAEVLRRLGFKDREILHIVRA